MCLEERNLKEVDVSSLREDYISIFWYIIIVNTLYTSARPFSSILQPLSIMLELTLRLTPVFSKVPPCGQPTEQSSAGPESVYGVWVCWV